MKSTTIFLILVISLGVLISGCTTNTTSNTVDSSSQEVSSDQIAEEAVTGWLDENEDVQIGGMN